MKKAKVVNVRIDSKNMKASLRAGEKGTGQELFAVTYWPDSPRSVEKKDEILFDWCNRNGVELVY